MPKKLTDERKDEIVIDGNFDDISDAELDIDEQMGRVIGDFGDCGNNEIKINVQRIIPSTGKKSYCFKCTPAEFPIQDKLRDEYKGGDFEIWVFLDGKLKKRINTTIEPPPKNSAETDARNDMHAVLDSMQSTQSSQFAQMKEMMQISQHQQIAPAQPQINMVEMMQGIVSLMAAMQQMIPKPVQNPPIDQMGNFIKGLEFAKDMGGGGESNGWDGINSLLKHAAPVLVDMANKNPQPEPIQDPNMAQPQHLVQPPGQPSVQPPPQPQEVQDVNKMQEVVLKRQIDLLVQKAGENSDPTIYADLLLDNWSMLPAEIAEKVLNDTNPVGVLAEINSGVNNNPVWFSEFFEHIKTAFEKPEESEELTETDKVGDTVISNDTEIPVVNEATTPIEPPTNT